MKKTIITIIVILIILLAVFIYYTRTPSAPTQSVESTVNYESPNKAIDKYTISKGSVVEFRIGEILRDKPFTAVGTTSEIAGEINVSNDAISMSTLAINAKTFKTDDSRRDGAITRLILKSEKPENEFMYFKPTSITGTSTKTISGDLTISGITKPATFTAIINITDSAITGTATTTLKRSDFNLVIPNIPFVASVDDTFTVTTKIVANKI